MLNSPFSFAPRSDTHTSFEPSGESMGKLLKSPSEVTCSRPVPSSLMRNKWNVRRWGSWTLDEKMIRRPSGWKNGAKFAAPFRVRSEEHTSELQSQSNLVCRLLLEKKKRRRHSC